MDDRTTVFEKGDRDDDHRGEPQAIGEILAELLARYRASFPTIHIAVVESPVAV